MERNSTLHEDGLSGLARIAGITITPKNRAAVIARLKDLRDGVMALDQGIPAEAVPAIRFDPGWEN